MSRSEVRKRYIYLFLGGAFGASLRFSISLGVHDYFGTLTVNLAGCFLMPLILDLLAGEKIISREITLFLGTGLIGAFTTFSAFSFENVNLFYTGQFGQGIIYTSACIFGGLLFAFLGTLTAKAISAGIINKRRARE